MTRGPRHLSPPNRSPPLWRESARSSDFLLGFSAAFAKFFLLLKHKCPPSRFAFADRPSYSRPGFQRIKQAALAG